ncbi:hypothetical protein TNCV_4939961 [Trichonephila clavipes]|nr:hypothetical protein TNCV_4939961 [Trichonephila clavipes]
MGPRNLLLQLSPQVKVQWNHIKRTFRPIFDIAIPNYLIPESLDEELIHGRCLVSRRAVMFTKELDMVVSKNGLYFRLI